MSPRIAAFLFMLLVIVCGEVGLSDGAIHERDVASMLQTNLAAPAPQPLESVVGGNEDVKDASDVQNKDVAMTLESDPTVDKVSAADSAEAAAQEAIADDAEDVSQEIEDATVRLPASGTDSDEAAAQEQAAEAEDAAGESDEDEPEASGNDADDAAAEVPVEDVEDVAEDEDEADEAAAEEVPAEDPEDAQDVTMPVRASSSGADEAEDAAEDAEEPPAEETEVAAEELEDAEDAAESLQAIGTDTDAAVDDEAQADEAEDAAEEEQDAAAMLLASNSDTDDAAEEEAPAEDAAEQVEDATVQMQAIRSDSDDAAGDETPADEAEDAAEDAEDGAARLQASDTDADEAADKDLPTDEAEDAAEEADATGRLQASGSDADDEEEGAWAAWLRLQEGFADDKDVQAADKEGQAEEAEDAAEDADAAAVVDHREEMEASDAHAGVASAMETIAKTAEEVQASSRLVKASPLDEATLQLIEKNFRSMQVPEVLAILKGQAQDSASICGGVPGTGLLRSFQGPDYINKTGVVGARGWFLELNFERISETITASIRSVFRSRVQGKTLKGCMRTDAAGTCQDRKVTNTRQWSLIFPWETESANGHWTAQQRSWLDGQPCAQISYLEDMAWAADELRPWCTFGVRTWLGISLRKSNTDVAPVPQHAFLLVPSTASANDCPESKTSATMCI